MISACVNEFTCCLLGQGEDALAQMLMLFFEMTFSTNMVSRNDDKENVPLWCESPHSWGKKASLPAAGAALVLGIAHILAAVSRAGDCVQSDPTSALSTSAK